MIVWEMKHTSSKDKLVPQWLWLLDLNLQGRVVDLRETDCMIDLGLFVEDTDRFSRYSSIRRTMRPAR